MGNLESDILIFGDKATFLLRGSGYEIKISRSPMPRKEAFGRIKMLLAVLN